MSDLKQLTKPEARSTRKLGISSLDRAVFKEPYAREVRTHTTPFFDRNHAFLYLKRQRVNLVAKLGSRRVADPANCASNWHPDRCRRYPSQRSQTS